MANGGTKPTLAALTIFYNQGTQKYDLAQTLQPDEQMWIDIGKLIRENVPDRNGKTLPPNLTSGSYEIWDLTHKGIGIGTLYEGKVIYDKTYGHVTYGCVVCCGYSFAQVFFNPLGIPFTGTSDNGVNGLDSCGAVWLDVSDSFYGNWSTANTSIATVDYYGTHSGVSVGSTTSTTSGFLSSTKTTLQCPLRPFNPSGGDNTTPVISSISPSRGLIGATTKSVAIAGRGFTGGQVNTSTTTIQAQNVTISDDQHITLDLAISANATTGNNSQAIYVTASCQNSNKVDFYVQVPTTLSITSSKTGSEGLCNNNAWCGTSVSFTYQVNDQDSPAQPIKNTMSFWDSFGATSPDPLQIDANGGYRTTCSASGKPNSGPCGQSTLSSGQFTEAALGACSPVCIASGACTTGGPSKVNQTWHIASSSIVQQISIYCEKVLVNGQ